MAINDQLRQRAEARFLENSLLSSASLEAMSPEATRQILHELGVHQIELEMQNEELRQSQVALDASRSRYFDLYDLAPVGYCTLNEPGLILQVNLTAATLLGVTRDALNNNLLSKFVLKEDQDIFYRYRKQLFESGKPQSCELRMVKHDGTPFWAHLEATAAQAADDATLVAHVILTDITERKKSEADLRIASAAFESQESLMITDANGVILRVNQAFTETTGYTAEEAVGQSPSLLKSDRHNADFFRAMWETIHRTGKWQGEIWDRRKNGEIYPKYLTISAIKGDNGVVTHYVGSHFDITERKAAEEEINNLAFYDSLTQLPNRRLLNDRLGKTIASSKRSGRYGAVLFMDLDNFKPLNDTYGHGVGDLLLMKVARRITRCVREVDTVARFGGDEFVVILSELDTDKTESLAQAGIVAEKIRTTLAEPYVLTIQQEGKAETITVEHHCTSSIGVMLFINHEASTENIIKWADIAMYQAKESGGNLIRFYESKV